MTGSAADGPGMRGRRVRGRGQSAAIVYAALVLLVVGSSIPVPLLPLYGALLDLPANRIALLFGSYLATMVLALGLGSIPATQARPRLTMSAALVLAMVADILFLVGTEPALLTARILTGFSVGFGLGAGATLSLMLRGDHGRSVAATMTMVAGFIGICGTALLADLSPWPTTAPFVVHLLAAGAVLLLLALATMPVVTAHVRDPGAAPPAAPSAPPTRTAIVAGAAVGVLSWSLGNVVVGLGPTLVQGSMGTESVLAASFVAVLVAGFGIAGQYVAPQSRLRFSVTTSAWCLVAGALFVSAGIMSGQVLAILAGGALTGLGQGAGYRLGMLSVTRGVSPQRHGARTSLYAGVAYVSAAASVQIGGALMAGLGNKTGMLLFLAGFLVPLLALPFVCLVGRWRPAEQR